MHRSLLLSLSIGIAATPTTYAQNTRGASNYESVSAEPLTFTVPIEEEQPDRRERILAEADIASGHEFDWMEDYEVMEGLDLVEGEDAENDGDVNAGYRDFGNEDFMDEGFDMDSEEPDEEEDEYFDSTYGTEDGEDFFAQEEEVRGDAIGGEELEDLSDVDAGYDEVGTPLEANEPIARKLRRITEPKVKVTFEDEERYLAEKESMRDDSIPIFMPAEDEDEEIDLTPFHTPEYLEELNGEDQGERNLQSGCRWNQRRAKIDIYTDKAGWETSWLIMKTNGQVITRGPPNGRRYADNRRYIGGMCLSAGTYRFKVMDKFRDGMCGNKTGRGWYRFYINGAKKFNSPSNCNVNWATRVHTFQIRINNPAPQPNPAPRPNPAPNPSPSFSSGSRGGCSNVKVEFKVDKYAKETTVLLTGNGQTHLASRKDVGAYQTKTMQKCVPPGTYVLKLQDQDGICCSNGKGFYKMFVNGIQVISGGYFVGSKSHTVKIGSNWQAQMSTRDREWLNAHNSRRRKYNGGRGYVALRYSRTLASAARSYAARLGNNCKGALTHASGIQDGENLAKNMGSGNWGQQYSADKIMGRWVENELTWSYPKNAHYTQVVWRATQYVGCGESVQTINGNQICRVQVCRYARAGNCNVRNGNWRSEAWKDDTGCGRPCPSEGCFV